MSFLYASSSYDLLGTLNGFREFCTLYIDELVESGKWFTICNKIDDRQIDIMELENDTGYSLGQLIDGIYEYGDYSSNIFRYMLANFLCYVEVPTVTFKTDIGAYKRSYTKVIATSCCEVIAEWLGVDIEELPMKYINRVSNIEMDDGADILPYVKLTESKEGVRKVTVPRLDLDVATEGIRIIPLFMLKSAVDSLYNNIKDTYARVSFMKDGGQIRDLVTTADVSRIKDIYGDSDVYNDCVEGMYDGDFLSNKALSRGYIRLPEIGASRYEGLDRSMSYSRVIEVEYGVEPNLSFIDIDVSTVLPSFNNGLVSHKKEASAIVDMLIAFNLDGGAWDEGSKYNRDFYSVIDWAESQARILSVVFLRELALFMMANIQWFPHFTGKPSEEQGTEDSIGIE